MRISHLPPIGLDGESRVLVVVYTDTVLKLLESPLSPLGPVSPTSPFSPGRPLSPRTPLMFIGVAHSVVLFPNESKIANDIHT